MNEYKKEFIYALVAALASSLLSTAFKIIEKKIEEYKKHE